MLTDEELRSKTETELLDLALEECGELIQALVKMKRHGHAALGPTGIYYDNLQNIADENYQLGTVTYHLMSRYKTSVVDLHENHRPYQLSKGT